MTINGSFSLHIFAENCVRHTDKNRWDADSGLDQTFMAPRIWSQQKLDLWLCVKALQCSYRACGQSSHTDAVSDVRILKNVAIRQDYVETWRTAIGPLGLLVFSDSCEDFFLKYKDNRSQVDKGSVIFTFSVTHIWRSRLHLMLIMIIVWMKQHKHSDCMGVLLYSVTRRGEIEVTWMKQLKSLQWMKESEHSYCVYN